MYAYAGICLHASTHVCTHHMPHTSARLHVKPYPWTWIRGYPCADMLRMDGWMVSTWDGCSPNHIHVCTHRDGHWHAPRMAGMAPGIDLGVLRLRLGLGGVNPRTRCWRVPEGPLNALWVPTAFQGLPICLSTGPFGHVYMCVDAYVDGRRFTGMPLETRRRPVGTFRGEVGGFILPDGLRSPEGPQNGFLCFPDPPYPSWRILA